MISKKDAWPHMAQVIVRNLEDSVKRKLQRRAAKHGRSMEAEAREISSIATQWAR